MTLQILIVQNLMTLQTKVVTLQILNLTNDTTNPYLMTLQILIVSKGNDSTNPDKTTSPPCTYTKD